MATNSKHSKKKKLKLVKKAINLTHESEIIGLENRVFLLEITLSFIDKGCNPCRHAKVKTAIEKWNTF